MFWDTSEVFTAGATVLAGGMFALYLRENARLAKLRREHHMLARSAAALEESATDAIVTVDSKGLIRGYNPAAEKLFGYAPREVYGQSFAKLLGPNVAPQNSPHAEMQEAQGDARIKGGRTIPVRLRVASTKLHPPEVWMFVQDLSGEQRSAQLEAENGLLWPAFEEAGLLIAIVDREGRMIRTSNAGAHFLNASDAELEGRPYWEAFQREEHWSSARAAFDQAKRKLGPSRIKAEWVRADGSPVPLDWLMLSPAWDEKGDLLHVVVTAALANLAARRQMLRMVERVAGRIAGHFENLLSTINGYSELVLHDLAPASPLRKDVEQVLAASQRASETTRQLLGFSGSRLLSTERLDVNLLLERMKRSLPEKMRYAVEMRLHPEPAVVLGNRKVFEEALLVLAEYAAGTSANTTVATEPVRLSETHPALTTDLPPGDYVKLSASLSKVSEEDVLQHLLEPFASPLRGAVNSTVGLAVLSGLARTAGGGITLQAAPESVTIEIWLPAAGASAQAPAGIEPKLLARAAP